MSPQRDRLVLALICREAVNGVTAMRLGEIAWIAGGGGLLAAYGLADVYAAIGASAEALRHATALWLAGIPAAAVVFGSLSGLAIGRLTTFRAYAPFLVALPLAQGARRRMAAVAGVALGLPVLMLVGGMVWFAAMLVGIPRSLLPGLAAAVAWGIGFHAALALAIRMTVPGMFPEGEPAPDPRQHGFSIAPFDRGRPAWLSAWAWNFPRGVFTIGRRRVATAALLAVTAFFAIGASLGQGRPGPAIVAGLIVAVLVFMASLRSDPLASPVLRTSSVSFGQAVRRLVRLPLMMSLALFAVFAGPAFAAEPAGWVAPVSGGAGLILLEAIYTVFAVYFVGRRMPAIFAFLSALALTAYESLEYGRPVGLGLLALLIWLLLRARRRYRYG